MTRLEAIKKALRVPDCEHRHLSYPDADAKAILASLKREGYIVVPAVLLDYLRDVLIEVERTGEMAAVRIVALDKERYEPQETD